MRLRIDLGYDGTDFHGWAAQPALRTVQGTLQAALARLLRVESVAVVCAGRTDTGVHARGQVVHLDVEEGVLASAAGRSTVAPVDALSRRLNGVLPPDVRVHRVVAAPARFDARFSAVWRRYAYRIADEASLVDPLTRGHVLAWSRRLDVEAMNEASGGLVGEHDFAAFCKKRAGATTVRTLLELSWSRHDRGVVVGHVRADAFCHHMVRALVGCLVAVGEGRREPTWPVGVLKAEAHHPAVIVVPAHGLTLEEVGYPPADELAARAETARRVRAVPHG